MNDSVRGHAEVLAAIRTLQTDFDVDRWTTPLKIQQARERVEAALRGTQNTPLVFEYDRRGLHEYERAIDRIEILVEQRCQEPLKSMVHVYLAAARTMARSLFADDESYASASAAEHGMPDLGLIDRARTILETSQEVEHSPAMVPDTYLVERTIAALETHEISGWSVELSASMGARMSVNGARRRVRVRSGTRFTVRDVDRLLVHEVGGHVMRWVNADDQEEPLAALALGSTVLTEEGLALWMEDHHGLLAPTSLRTYACRVLAVDLSSRAGIYDVARTLTEFLSLTEAAELAVRVKRGMRNPDCPGGLAKDWGYLGGLIAMNELYDADPEGHALLRGVKWSVSHLSLAKQLASQGKLREPTRKFDPVATGIGQGRRSDNAVGRYGLSYRR